MNVLAPYRQYCAILIVGLALNLYCPGLLHAAERELIRDPHFQRGMILLSVEPGKRAAYGKLPGLAAEDAPVWDLCQWSSKKPLQPTELEHPIGGALRYTNAGKMVAIAKPESEGADITLAVQGSFEYAAHARKQGEPWVHLLLQQEIENPPALSDINTARLHVEARLLASKKIDTPDYTPNLHAAQFQIFFSVQNRNQQSPGYGQYLWFGIPIYDDRHRVAPSHKTQDTGGTKMFIFTPRGDVFTPRSAHDKQWISIDKDLLPLMREGLEMAWSQGFLKDSKSFADYRIAGMNLGWEVPGTFDVEMQTRNLSLKVSK